MKTRLLFVAAVLACCFCGCEKIFPKPRPVSRPAPVRPAEPEPAPEPVRRPEPARKQKPVERPKPVETEAPRNEPAPETTVAVPEPEEKPAVKESVLASEFGFDPYDATECLQAALDSGAKKVVIDRQKSDWVTEPLRVRGSDLEIVICDGVTIRAKPGSFRGQNDSLLTVGGRSENVTIRGEGRVRLVMNKKDYQDASKGYESSEWRHALVLQGRRTLVKNLMVVASGGDGVYVAGARDTVIEDLVCEDHHRQGISVISCAGFTARNCSFCDTSGTAPQCGLDIEPNSPGDHVDDVLFEKCTFAGNASAGILLYLANLTPETKPISVTFRDCISTNNAAYGVSYRLTAEPKGARGRITFERCTVSGNRNGAVFVQDQPPDSVELMFRNCRFDGRGCRSTVPIQFDNRKIPANLAGVAFDETVLVTGKDNEAIRFDGMEGAGVTGLGGTVYSSRGTSKRKFDLRNFMSRHKPDPKARPVAFTSAAPDLMSLRPVARRLKKPAVTPLMKSDFTFYQYVPSAGEYRINFKAVPTQGNSGPVSVAVSDRSGTDYGTVAPSGKDGTVVLKAKGENLFVLKVDVGYNHVSVSSPWPGCGIPAHEMRTFARSGSPCRWHFAVPAKAVSVLADVKPGSASAQLCKRGRTPVSKIPVQDAAAVLHAERKPSAKDEVWSLDFPVMRGSSSLFRIGGDAVPIVSGDPDAVLTVAGTAP